MFLKGTLRRPRIVSLCSGARMFLSLSPIVFKRGKEANEREDTLPIGQLVCYPN